MKKFNFIIPCHGCIITEIIAETPEDAINIITEKKANLEYHPNGHLELEIENCLITYNNEKVQIN